MALEHLNVRRESNRWSLLPPVRRSGRSSDPYRMHPNAPTYGPCSMRPGENGAQWIRRGAQGARTVASNPEVGIRAGWGQRLQIRLRIDRQSPSPRRDNACRSQQHNK